MALCIATLQIFRNLAYHAPPQDINVPLFWQACVLHVRVHIEVIYILFYFYFMVNVSKNQQRQC